jgi:hypothetical protein
MKSSFSTLSRSLGVTSCRVPHSFAFFANEWASANERDGSTLSLTKRRARTTLGTEDRSDAFCFRLRQPSVGGPHFGHEVKTELN